MLGLGLTLYKVVSTNERFLLFNFSYYEPPELAGWFTAFKSVEERSSGETPSQLKQLNLFLWFLRFFVEKNAFLEKKLFFGKKIFFEKIFEKFFEKKFFTSGA